MDFRRIDKNTVQCILSEEEMSAYGFRIEDFFSNQEKAREFLEHLVERAEEEIGYEAHSGMVSMQIMKLPDNGIVITLSERDNSADGFQNMLQNIHQQLASILGPEAADQLMEQEGEAAMESEYRECRGYGARSEVYRCRRYICRGAWTEKDEYEAAYGTAGTPV